MDLDHYKIESMKAVSEGKCLIVGFALTAFKDITWYLYCTAPITHTWKTFRLVHSDLNSQLFHCFTSPFWRSKGRRRDMRQVPKKNHRSVCISFLGTLHCVKYWHTCQYIFGTPPQQSLTEGTISALWALSQWSQLLTKSFTAPSCVWHLHGSKHQDWTCLPHEIKMHSPFQNASFLFCVWSLSAQARRIWCHLFWRTSPGTSNVSLPVGILSPFIILCKCEGIMNPLLLSPPVTSTERTPHFHAIVSSQLLLFS